VIPLVPVEQTRAEGRLFRSVLAVLAVLLWIFCLVPPFAHWSRQYQFVESIQFCLFAVCIPALLIIGAPWRWLGLASWAPVEFTADGFPTPASKPRLMDRLAVSRLRRSGDHVTYALGTLFVLTTIFWRIAPVVDFGVTHAWLAPVESIGLVIVGLLLWLDLVESPPMKPGAPRPFRIGMAAVSMWVVWVLAYLGAMSGRSWYPAFAHVTGRGVSLAADQQLSTGFMWLLSASSFLPVIFWNLIHWLQSEENPDDELTRMMRREKVLGTIANKE
jgi:cytochrome c oxidase assembly factor CtaG